MVVAASAGAVKTAKSSRAGLRKHPGPLLLLLWATLPWVVALALLPVQSLLVGRYFIVASPAIVALAAIGVGCLAGRAGRAATLVLVVLSCAGIVEWWTRPSEEAWRSATRFVLSAAEPGDAVVFVPWFARSGFEAYARRDGRHRHLVPIHPSEPWGRFMPGTQRTPVGFTDLRSRLSAARSGRVWRVWVVERTSAVTRSREADRRVIRRLLGAPNLVRNFRGVRVSRYAATRSVQAMVHHPSG
ncbi:MAG: hypothetical protein C4344_04805 [Acidimicrobiia bacterium]